MHDLFPFGTALPGALTTAELEAARGYEKAEATRTAYRGDWRLFGAWCRERRLEALPASPETVAGFLEWQADTGAKASSIARRSAAIRYAHRLVGREPPTADECVRAVSRRTIGTAPDRKAPATADVIVEMLKRCPAA